MSGCLGESEGLGEEGTGGGIDKLSEGFGVEGEIKDRGRGVFEVCSLGILGGEGRLSTLEDKGGGDSVDEGWSFEMLEEREMKSG